MPGLLEYALRADAPQMGLLGRLGAFLNERQDFANNRMRQLRESEWRPWEWDYDTKAAEIRGLLAGQAGGGPAPDWTSMVGDALGTGVTPGLLGILAGPKGAARVPGLLDKLEDAKAMVAKGAADEDVWQATGWWVRTPDGVPRWEIPDTDAGFKPSDFSGKDWMDSFFVTNKGGIEQGTQLGEALDHPGLFQAYPRFSDIAYSERPSPYGIGDMGAEYSQGGGIRIGKGAIYRVTPDWKETSDPKFKTGWWPATLHETQHAVQDIEDMARGGSIAEFSLGTRERTIRDAEILRSLMNDNPNNWNIEVFNEFRSALGRDPEPGAIQTALRTKWDKLLEMLEDPTRKYRRLAGEAEARAVQARADKPLDWLKAHGPWESYLDVPIEDLIIRR